MSATSTSLRRPAKVVSPPPCALQQAQHVADAVIDYQVTDFLSSLIEEGMAGHPGFGDLVKARMAEQGIDGADFESLTPVFAALSQDYARVLGRYLDAQTNELVATEDVAFAIGVRVGQRVPRIGGVR